MPGVHQRINADHVALVVNEQQISYRELNARANRLAHYLRSRGVGPEANVGVCMDRAAEMVIALLGVLKSGGAFRAQPGCLLPPEVRVDDAEEIGAEDMLVDFWNEIGGGELRVPRALEVDKPRCCLGIDLVAR